MYISRFQSRPFRALASLGALAMVAISTPLALASSDTWLGTTADWNLATNWVGGVAPVSTATVTLPSVIGAENAPTISGVTNNTITEMILASSTGGWTINSGSSGDFLTIAVNGTGIDASALTSGSDVFNIVLNLGGGQTWTVGSGGTLVFNGNVKNNPNITQNGAGTVVFNAANTMSGTYFATAGNIVVGANNVFGTAPVTWSSSGTLMTSGAYSTADLLTLNSALNFSGTLTDSGTLFTGTVTGTSQRSVVLYNSSSLNVSAVVKDFSATSGGGLNITAAGTGTSTLSLAGANTFTGGVTVGSGVQLNVNASSALGTGTLTLNDGSTLSNTVGASVSNAMTVSGSVAFTPLSFGETGVIAGSGTIFVGGAGLTIFQGASTFTGGVQVGNGATIRLNSTAAIGTGTLTLAAGSTLASSVTGSFANNISVTGAAFVAPTSTTNLAETGIISGAGSLTFNSGTTTLKGTNTFSGGATINAAATVNIQNASAFGASSGTLTVVGGVITDTTASYVIANSLAITGSMGTAGISIIEFGGAVSLGAGTTGTTVTMQLNNSNQTRFDGVISNGGSGVASLSLKGQDVYFANAANTFSGTVIANNGRLEVQSLANGGVASSLGMSSSAASNIQLSGITLVYFGSTLATTDRLFTLGTAATTTFDARSGQYNFNGSGAIAMATTSTVANRTLTLTTEQTSGTSFLTPVLSNASDGSTLSIIKTSFTTGNQTWVLGGNNTYTGSTVVTAGTLLVSGSLGSTAVTVSSTAALGLGKAAGAASFGTLNVASLALTGSSTGINGSKLLLNLGASGASDTLGTTGAITITGAGQINLVLTLSGVSDLTAGFNYNLLTWATGSTVLPSQISLAGSSTQILTDISNGSFSLQNVGSSLELVSAVPEPSTWALFGCGLAVAGWTWNRKRTRRQSTSG